MHLAEMRQRKLVEGGCVSWRKQTGIHCVETGWKRTSARVRIPAMLHAVIMRALRGASKEEKA